MKKLIFLLLPCLLCMSCWRGMPFYKPNKTIEACSIQHDQIVNLLNADLKPFYYGVASGDPLADRVIIWTQVEVDKPNETIDVHWELAATNDFKEILQKGVANTNEDKDYTIKVDVKNLQADQYYFYRFHYNGKYSAVGRTKTAPLTDTKRVKFAVISCSNYEWGYFNAYGRIAEKENIDAVLHLGDYIYEYKVGGYGNPAIGRTHLPAHEIVTKADYQMRYRQYRLDEDLQKAHQMHPFITIWDDHEVANDAHTTGAHNHQEAEEGDYLTRMTLAKEVYYNWMPIRANDNGQLYRNFSYGNLVDLVMLDERLAGRTAQAHSLDDPSYMDQERTMLGKTQLEWFLSQLETSKATWKIIGNQVIFSDLKQETIFPKEPLNLDAWDGYPVEKQAIIDFIVEKDIDNLCFITGDTHCSWAFDVPTSIADYNKDAKAATIGVEFGTPGISSSNFDEYVGMDTVWVAQRRYKKLNPHLKYVNLSEQGYFLLTLDEKEARADFYFVDTVLRKTEKERLAKSFKVKRNKGRL